jgi:hypothetical protein
MGVMYHAPTYTPRDGHGSAMPLQYARLLASPSLRCWLCVRFRLFCLQSIMGLSNTNKRKYRGTQAAPEV